MKVSCYRCGKEFHKSPSEIREHNFCSKSCRLQWWGVWTVKNMNVPGHSKGHMAPHLTLINKARSGNTPRIKRQKPNALYAGVKGRSAINRLRNYINNPMKDPEIRKKVGDRLRNRGEGRTYRKYLGRHEHRVVAEQKLGRPLTKDEIVHHIDGNKRNNDPINLMIVTRAEHARIHISKKKY